MFDTSQPVHGDLVLAMHGARFHLTLKSLLLLVELRLRANVLAHGLLQHVLVPLLEVLGVKASQIVVLPVGCPHIIPHPQNHAGNDRHAVAKVWRFGFTPSHRNTMVGGVDFILGFPSIQSVFSIDVCIIFQCPRPKSPKIKSIAGIRP